MKIKDVSKLKGPLAELHNQLFGQNGEERLAELNLWLKRVGEGIFVAVNRALTPEQAVNATGRVWWFKNQIGLDSAPVSGPDQVELEIFELDYEPTPTKLEAEYRSRGLRADLGALSAYMREKPEVADHRPIACQWGLNPNGTADYAIFYCYARERRVSVARDGGRWNRRCRFAGFR